MSESIPTEFGQFQGRLILEPLPDGRLMQLIEPYAFVDPAQKTWAVPKGAKVDGASIPQILWTLIGGPFEGKYRNASVIHDFYCDTRTEPWQAVHRVFFHGMRTAGVSAFRAKAMYAAVYHAGPRWTDAAIDNIHLSQGQLPRATSPKGTMGVQAVSALQQAMLGALTLHSPAPADAESGMRAMRTQTEAVPAPSSLSLKWSALEALIEDQDPSLDDMALALDAAEKQLIAQSGTTTFERVLLLE
jgi:hypothetical protein